MPWPPLDRDSFNGAIDINIVAADTTLSKVINQYYAHSAMRIVGVADYNTIQGLADPMPEKWNDLLNGSSFKEEQSERSEMHQPGVLKAVKYMLYFQYGRLYFKAGTQGLVKNNASVADVATMEQVNAKIATIWNEAYAMSESIVSFVEAYTNRSYSYASIVGTAPTFTVNLADTTYMANGDTVTIGEKQYTISNLVDDTSFQVTASSMPSGKLRFTAFPNHEDYQTIGIIV